MSGADPAPLEERARRPRLQVAPWEVDAALGVCRGYMGESGCGCEFPNRGVKKSTDTLIGVYKGLRCGEGLFLCESTKSH